MTIRIAKVEAELKARPLLEERADRKVADGLRILARIIARAYLESRMSDQGERVSNEERHGNEGTD
jgi:hypothetical protein